MEIKNNSLIDKKRRIIYFDYLRIFATISVIILHVASQKWEVSNVNTFEWQVFNFFDSITRWGVPIFLMISGSLFLERNISIKKILSKYVLKMIIAFLIWSTIYTFFTDLTEITLFDRLIMIFSGHYHMWYIPTIIGIYICIPIIKLIIENKKKAKYYLIISLIFAFLIPQISTLIYDFGGEKLISLNSAINKFIINMNMNFVLGFTSYFILGYYINNIEFNKKQRIIIYSLGILGGLLTIILNWLVSIKNQTPCGNYYNNFSINVLFESVAIFVLFKYAKLKSNDFIVKLSQYSFGAYLVHPLIIEQLESIFGLNTLSFNPLISVTSITLITFGMSFSISAILNCIPVLKKYIV